MYMAPIQRSRKRQRNGGVKFLFGLSAFLGALAIVGYVFLVGQGQPAYQIQASLDTNFPLQTAATKAGRDGVHALWVGSNSGVGRKSPQETFVKPSQVDQIAPGSGGRKVAAIRHPPKGAAPKTAPTAPTRSVAQLPTKRPKRAADQSKTVQPRRVAGRRAPVRRRTRSVAQATTADMIGPYRIQVGSFRTPEAAHDKWISLRQRHKDLLGSYIMVIEKVNRGRRGVVYRLQAGPLRTRGAVSKVCSRLSKRRIGCSLVDG
jgi:hypothetical protein